MAPEYPELIREIQNALQAEHIDGWLLYNFRDSNIFATRLLALPKHIMFTRRYFYFIPAKGEPRKLVHRIEEWNLDALPGGKQIYLSWRSLEDGLKSLLAGATHVAMEYSPRCAIPYVSTVDAGVVELVRSTGVNIVSSANLIQYFEARWDDEQLRDCKESAAHLRQIVEVTFGFIRQQITSSISLTEFDVQQFMLSEFKKRGLCSSSDPNCSVNANSANPHYEPTKDIHSPVQKGDYVLLDLWAKKDKARSVYADITWMGFLGDSVPDEFENIFQIVKGGRNAALEFVRSSFKAGTMIHGYEVDDAARHYIAQHGYGEYFVHRTGHSIGEEVHGNGANMDNLETRDERTVIPQTSFSLEPGIYLRDKYGIRSEIDVYISKDREVIVTGLPMQENVVPVLR
ncbi:MAG: aminopeptidase P family protein [Ignavibacteriae bacterium]|nr:MAG: aminopeptidase P family protein [Ignavibacteriota bacterium]